MKRILKFAPTFPICRPRHLRRFRTNISRSLSYLSTPISVIFVARLLTVSSLARLLARSLSCLLAHCLMSRGCYIRISLDHFHILLRLSPIYLHIVSCLLLLALCSPTSTIYSIFFYVLYSSRSVYLPLH